MRFILPPQNAAHLFPLAFWYFFDILAFTILLTWVFNNTGGSLLLVALFHTASNVSDWIVPTFHAITDVASLRPFILQGIFGWVAAFLIIAMFGAKTLRRKMPILHLAETSNN